MNAGLNNEEQKELQSRMERKQMRDFMNTYSNLVQRCFDDCVNDFTSKTLQAKEEGCVFRCVDKFMKGTERLGQRFQELNAEIAQSNAVPGARR